jgi:nucleoside-diphosphate-sugar epimerase
MTYSHILVSLTSITLALTYLRQVTGGNGFVGSQVVYQLLEAGYKVRAPVRTGKTGDVKNAFLSYWKNGKLDIPEYEDLTKVDFAPWLESQSLRWSSL